jgi:4-phytase / acid phosphatase
MRIIRETDSGSARRAFVRKAVEIWLEKRLQPAKLERKILFHFLSIDSEGAVTMFKRLVILLGLVLTLTVPVRVQVLAQTITNNDGTTLKQIIIFGRHSIRSATTPTSTLSSMAVDPWPPFEVSPGCLTPNGTQAETFLGGYYRQYLLYEGLLTGNDGTDSVHSYFRSNSIERSWATASAFGTGLIPEVTVPVHSFQVGPNGQPGQPDPVFDPILAKVVQKVDANLAATQAQEIFNSGAALASAYSGEYSLIRNVLFDYLPPPSDCNSLPCVDPTSQAITLAATTGPLYTGGVINMGGLASTIGAADPFVMQYADGLEVGWGRLTPDQVSQQTRLISLQFNIEMLSPYLNQVQSSNAASHVLRTMQQAVNGFNVPGAFGDAGSRTVVVISSDAYVAGLAGLLHLHWQLPGYQPDFCAPGGALVFELRQSNTSKEYLVRAFYTAQTFDQLRNLTPLSLNEPPATIQLLVPGAPTGPDVDFGVFRKLMSNAIGPAYVQNPSQEAPPDVLTGVSCQ